jgi:hypothetical protein
MAITVDMIDAIKVQFLRPIFEDDFVEKGMKAWLVDIDWDNTHGCYQLYFDFTEFEAENDKYLKEVFHPNRRTALLPDSNSRRLFTAKEAGQYSPKYSVYFSCGDQCTQNDAAFAEEIVSYLREVA